IVSLFRPHSAPEAASVLTKQEKGERLRQLRDELTAFGSGGATSERDVVSTGLPALDRALPLGGVRRGSLTEWLSDRAGGGAESLALLLTREACRGRGAVVLVDRARQVYPPALAAGGVAPDRV